MAYIQVNNVTFSYGSNAIVFERFSADLLKHRVVGLLGPSGTGKTTLLRLLCGLESPVQGEITINSASPAITFVPQDPVLFEHYSRKENAIYRSLRGAYRDRFTTSRFERLREVLSLNDGFLDDRRPLPGMSGGQRQRLVLLRELSIAPDLLLLDEPCTGLDPGVKRDFLLLLAELLYELDIKCVYATHHFDEVQLLADEILYLHRKSNGACTGNPQDLNSFIAYPPTIDAAVALLGPLATVLRGYCKTSDQSDHCEIFCPESGSNAQDWLVMPITSVRGAKDGIRGNVLSRTGYAVLLSIGGQPITLRSSDDADSVLCAGDGYVFCRRQSGRKINAQTVRKDNQWQVILVPQL